MKTLGMLDEILASNAAREDAFLCERACKSVEAARLDPAREKVPDFENIRSPFFHDADKILHSLAYTRYIDKTQVFYLFENDHITHRVLHVQFVSKIARTIARCLRLNEELVEAIALGHDIGHVPFGHDGEEFLHRICERNGIGSFCHNAQSVRWMRELEGKGRGVNLCLQTLDGILAHNGEILSKRLAPQRDKTWDEFKSEYDQCMMDRDRSKQLRPMTLEGCVMRFSDIIAYVGRDIEDAMTLGLMKRGELPDKAVAVLGDNNSSIINTLVLDLIEQSYGQDYLRFSEPVFEALDELLAFNYERIYRDPRVREDEGRLQRLFDVIYEDCLKALREKDPNSGIVKFYSYYMAPEHLIDTPPARAVVDFISGMTDDFFLTQARRILLPGGFGRTAKG